MRPALFSAIAQNRQKDLVSWTEISAIPVTGCRSIRTRKSPGRLCVPGAVPVGAMDTGSRRKMHGLTVGGPFHHGDDSFAVILGMDTTGKATGKRPPGGDARACPVQDGKVAREKLFSSA
jgi:hypothetical protein